jgi:hypothetical protein
MWTVFIENLTEPGMILVAPALCELVHSSKERPSKGRMKETKQNDKMYWMLDRVKCILCLTYRKLSGDFRSKK